MFFLSADNIQFVRGKCFVRPEEGRGSKVNEEYLATVRDKEKAPIAKYDLPQTSAQVIGWFAKPEPAEAEEGAKYSRVCVPDFRAVAEVNHAKVDSDILRFKDDWWRFNPPPKAKFHPKAQ